MCIAIYKPDGVQFPPKKTLQRCFDANPDGAGYMFAQRDRVHIRKGFTTFKAFWRDLRDIRAKVTDSPAFVLHFRISTQAGTRPDCTHPFPLSRNMDDLRETRFCADIGVAHNGIITLTSQSYNRTITYSDTMKFITDYAARLIKSREWYKDDDIREVVEDLADSKLAILDGGGHCTLLGNGWIEDGGVYYSNASYKPAPPKPAYTENTLNRGFRAYDYYNGWYDDYYGDDYETDKKTESDDTRDPFAESFDSESGLYYFDDMTCPATAEQNYTYCTKCAYYGACYGFTE